jgi:hypothetical protein
LPPPLDPRRCWIPSDSHASAMRPILPSTFYSHSQYIVTKGYAFSKPTGISAEVNLPFLPAAGKKFGKSERQSLSIPAATLVVTNIQPFPWNQILVNGRPKSAPELVAIKTDWEAARSQPTVLAVPLKAGHYSFQYRFHPSNTWKVLEKLSFAILGLWLFVFIIAIIGTRQPRPN